MYPHHFCAGFVTIDPMPDSEPLGEITVLLKEAARGDTDAQARLAPIVYEELRRIARRRLAKERANHTLQTTELVNEAYLRLSGTNLTYTDRAHFFAVAATQMRRILVDYARGRRAQKRGGPEHAVTFDENLPVGSNESWDRILSVHQALDRLAALDPRKARVVELRFFTGLEVHEIAEVMGVSPRTIKRDLQFAQTWLYSAMFPDATKGAVSVTLSKTIPR